MPMDIRDKMRHLRDCNSSLPSFFTQSLSQLGIHRGFMGPIADLLDFRHYSQHHELKLR